MIKYFKVAPSNEAQDAFAFENGSAITMRSPQAFDYPPINQKAYALITPDELDEFRVQGWKVLGTINRSDDDRDDPAYNPGYHINVR